MQNSQDENLATPQKSANKQVLGGISPIMSGTKAQNPPVQYGKGTIFGMTTTTPQNPSSQIYKHLQMPILNKFRRNEGAQRGISNPRDSKLIQPEQNQQKPAEIGNFQKMTPVRAEYGKGDLNIRYEMSDRASATLYQDDENLLISPDKEFFENQDSKQSILSTPPNNNSGYSGFFERAPGQKDNVKVVIRVRPLNDRELSQGQNKSVLAVENSEKIVLDRGADQKIFTFDYVADICVPQQDIFTRIAQPVADSCLLGYNGSIFAYGQTGSGKTFTIQGPTIKVGSDEAIVSSQNSTGSQFEMRGLMQRSFEYIFQMIEREKSEKEQKGCEVSFLVKASYLEIYNEQIMDLLDPQSINLHVREDIKKGVYVESLQEEVISSVKDMINLITRGARNRHVGSTLMNKESSRSHSVLTTQIESKILSENGVWQMKSSRFHIIDLAGSERSKHTNSEGQRLKEAGMINKSLSALGIVINSLVEISEGKTRHVHYRDSKLTFLLRDSLGGNSKTTIIAAVTPAQASAGETLSTLKFAQRAKLIKNKAVINEESSSTIHMLKLEIRRLKMELAEGAHARKLLQDNINTQPQLQEQNLCVLCKSKLNNGEDDASFQFGNNSVDGDNEESVEIRKIQSSPGNEDSNISLNVSQFATQQFPSQANPKAFKMYRERMEQLKKAQKRIVYLENLLSANLDNLTSQQKYYELKIEKNKEQTERMQSALETFEKQSSRDKMIIKFREQRIQKLEEKIEKDAKCKVDGEKGCSECEKLIEEIENLRQERDSWKESSDRNPQAAKLFVEKAELVMQRAQLEAEARVTPESLTAQIRGLNELTESLSNYLKEHCESRSKEREDELNAAKTQLTEQVASLELELQQNAALAKENEHRICEDFNMQIEQLMAKIETLKVQSSAEKELVEQSAQAQIKQIKKDLEAVSGETQNYEHKLKQFTIESAEKQSQQQHKINQLQSQLSDVEEKEARAQTIIGKLQDQAAKLTIILEQRERDLKDQQANFEWQVDSEREQLETKLRSIQEANFQDTQTLEKQVLQAQQESELLQEHLSDTKDQLEKIKKENDFLTNQLLVAQEESQETHRIVKELEHQYSQLEKEHEQEVAELTAALEKANQSANSSEREVERCQKLISDKDHQLSEFSQAKTEQSVQLGHQVKSLEEKLASTENEVVRKQQEIDAQSEQIVLQQSQLTSQRDSLGRSMQTLSQIEQQAKSFASDNVRLKQELQALIDENESLKEQINAMDEITVNLTKENIEKQEALIKLKADAAKQITQLQQASKDSQIHQQEQTASLKSQIQELHQKHEFEIQLLQQELIQDKQNALSQLQLQAKEKLEEETTAVQAAVQNHFLQVLRQQELEVRDKVKAESNLTIEQVVTQKQREIHQLTQSLNQTKKTNLKALQILQKQVSMLKRELVNVREQVLMNDFSNIAPSISQQMWTRQIVSLAEQAQHQNEQTLISQHQKQVYQLEQKVKEHQKSCDQQRNQTQQVQQDYLELKEQLNEYKGLSHQLTEEKQIVNEQVQSLQSQLNATASQSSHIIESLNSQLMTTQRELAESHQMLTQQKQLLDDSLKQLNAQHIDKYQQQQKLYTETMKALNDENDKQKSQISKLTHERDKLIQKTSEHKGMLLSNKDTIQSMVNNENQLMTELKKKITELGETQEHWKQKVIESKQEKEQFAYKADTLKKENENLRELIKLKDGQIQDNVQTESNLKSDREKLQQENKNLKNFMTMQENQMKEVVRTLKAFSEEKKRLEAELNQVRQNEFHIGHDNKLQKVQYHLKIKEEFNILKEENDRLQEELRKRSMDIYERQSNSQGGHSRDDSSSDMARMKKDQYVILESVSVLMENLLAQPGVSAYIADKRELREAFSNTLQTIGTVSAPQNTSNKIKAVIEVITNMGRNLSNRIKECNDMAREYKRLEQAVLQLQKEKTILTQQVDSLLQRQQMQSSGSKSSQINKDRYGSGNREQFTQQQMIPTKDSQPFQVQKMQANIMHQQVDQQRPSSLSQLGMQKSSSRASMSQKQMKSSQQ